jgi:hypothetical protein
VTKSKKAKAKIRKVRVVKVEKLDEDRHLVAAEYEVHGPDDSLPELPAAPLEIIPDELTPESPEKHWYDFLKG